MEKFGFNHSKRSNRPRQTKGPKKKTTKNISHEELPRWGMGGGDLPQEI